MPAAHLLTCCQAVHLCAEILDGRPLKVNKLDDTLQKQRKQKRTLATGCFAVARAYNSYPSETAISDIIACVF
jgi:hypothetical protein